MIKSRFRSRSEHTLDDKGRLNFPSRFREVLRQYESETLMITAWGKQHLRAYPLVAWDILENTLLTEGKGSRVSPVSSVMSSAASPNVYPISRGGSCCPRTCGRMSG